MAEQQAPARAEDAADFLKLGDRVLPEVEDVDGERRIESSVRMGKGAARGERHLRPAGFDPGVHAPLGEPNHHVRGVDPRSPCG